MHILASQKDLIDVDLSQCRLKRVNSGTKKWLKFNIVSSYYECHFVLLEAEMDLKHLNIKNWPKISYPEDARPGMQMWTCEFEGRRDGSIRTIVQSGAHGEMQEVATPTSWFKGTPNPIAAARSISADPDRTFDKRRQEYRTKIRERDGAAVDLEYHSSRSGAPVLNSKGQYVGMLLAQNKRHDQTYMATPIGLGELIAHDPLVEDIRVLGKWFNELLKLIERPKQKSAIENESDEEDQIEPSNRRDNADAVKAKARKNTARSSKKAATTVDDHDKPESEDEVEVVIPTRKLKSKARVGDDSEPESECAESEDIEDTAVPKRKGKAKAAKPIVEGSASEKEETIPKRKTKARPASPEDSEPDVDIVDRHLSSRMSQLRQDDSAPRERSSGPSTDSGYLSAGASAGNYKSSDGRRRRHHGSNTNSTSSKSSRSSGSSGLIMDSFVRGVSKAVAGSDKVIRDKDGNLKAVSDRKQSSSSRGTYQPEGYWVN